MATYKVWLTVKDNYGNTKEVDGGTINVDLATLTPDEVTQLQRHIHMGYDLIKYKNLPPIITTVLIVFLLIFTLLLAVEPIVYLSWCFFNKKISEKEQLISKLKKQMENYVFCLGKWMDLLLCLLMITENL